MISLLYLLLSLSILNIVYTIGFLAAQILSKTHHQHYFLGSDPKLLTFQIRKVKFSIGVYIPIIGLSRLYYVEEEGSNVGFGDSGDSTVKHIVYPWEFTNVSILKRLLITYSGVFTLLIFGVLLSIVAAYTSREQYISKEEVYKYGIYPSEQARALGFLPGDKVLALNGNDYEDFYELISPNVVQKEETYYTVLRGGEEMEIRMSGASALKLPRHEMFFSINAPFSVGAIMPESPAASAEIYEGDRITKVNGEPVVSWRAMNAHFQSDVDGEVLLEIERPGSSPERFEKAVALNADKKLGISINEGLQYQTREYSLLQSVIVGPKRFWSGLVSESTSFTKVVGFGTLSAERSLGGPIAIAPAFGEFNVSWWIYRLSIFAGAVVLLNFLPLPKSALLEIFPLGYEALTKRSLAYKYFHRIRQFSIGLLVLLVVWIFVSDMLRFF